MAKLEIEIISDFNCPWCEIARVYLNEALKAFKNLKYTIFWRPFLLYNIPEKGVLWSDHMKRKWGSPNPEWYSSLAEEVWKESIDIKNHCDRFACTINAHRLVELAYQLEGWEKGSKLHDVFLRGYYSEHKDLSNDNVIITDTISVGLKRDGVSLKKDEIQHYLDDHERKADFMKDTYTLAERFNVTSVPYFIINKNYEAFGAQPVERLVKMFRQAMSAQ